MLTRIQEEAMDSNPCQDCTSIDGMSGPLYSIALNEIRPLIWPDCQADVTFYLVDT